MPTIAWLSGAHNTAAVDNYIQEQSALASASSISCIYSAPHLCLPRLPACGYNQFVVDQYFRARRLVVLLRVTADLYNSTSRWRRLDIFIRKSWPMRSYGSERWDKREYHKSYLDIGDMWKSWGGYLIKFDNSMIVRRDGSVHITYWYLQLYEG